MLVGCGGGVPPSQQKGHFAIYIIIFAIYIIPRTALAMLTPTPSPFTISKSYFFYVTCFFRVCAYLPTGFGIYRMVLDHIILLTVL